MNAESHRDGPNPGDMSKCLKMTSRGDQIKLIFQNKLALNSVFSGNFPCNFGKVYLRWSFLLLYSALEISCASGGRICRLFSLPG